MSEHTLHIEAVDAVDVFLRARISCQASEGAWCRMQCPEGCEEWARTGHEHALVDAGHCLAFEWFENADDDVMGCYAGKEGPLSDGMPVDVKYCDGWEWSPASVPSGQQGVLVPRDLLERLKNDASELAGSLTEFPDMHEEVLGDYKAAYALLSGSVAEEQT